MAACLGSLPAETRSGGRRKPGAARRPVEGRVIDDAAAPRRRTKGDSRLAEGTHSHEGPGHGEDLLCKRTAQAVAPFHRQLASRETQRRCVLTRDRSSSHAAPCVRLLRQTSPVAQSGSSGTYPASNCASAARDRERRLRQEIPHRSWLIGARDQDLVFVRITRLFPNSFPVRIAGGERSRKRWECGESVMRRPPFKKYR